jgi:release factor glutamine methyltransferase
MPETIMAVRLDVLLRKASTVLRDAGIADAGREARLLTEHLAGVNAAEFLTDPGRQIAGPAQAAVEEAVRRRAQGEPLHRIVGKRGFYGIELALSPATLEPRPDTEILVERIIPHARRITKRDGVCKLLDLGTGTGAIALAVLKEVDGATALGVDIDDDAVATAMANARSNGLAGRFRAIRSDWFGGVNEKFHIIVSNPPYISSDEYAALPEEVRLFDPKTALLGGIDGLQAYRAIARSAAGYLIPDGIVGVETGYTQRDAVMAIFAEHGFKLVEEARDLAGHDRVLLFDLWHRTE